MSKNSKGSSSRKKGGEKNKGRKRKADEKMVHPVEFHAQIEGRKDDFYVLENLSNKMSSKGDDVLFYRLRFKDEHGFPHENHPFDICITRIKNAKREKKIPKTEVEEASMEIKERVRFQVKFPTILSKKVKRAVVPGINGIKDEFLILPNFQVHMNGRDRVKAIYFILEDNQLDARKQHKPKWDLAVDTTYCFERMFGDRYVPLDFVHPDPDVDLVDIPTEKRPQRSARWFNYRNELSDAKFWKFLKGKIGGSKATKFMGFYKGSGLGGAEEPSRILKLGRIKEEEILVAYLEYYRKRTVYEVGWYKHPNDETQGASPDWLTYDPEMTMSGLPGWFKELHSKAGSLKEVEARIKYGIGEAKTSERDADFKAGYIPQLYQEMISTNTYWSELIKFCPTTNEIKCYRVYRDPEFEASFRKAVEETKSDLCKGVPYIKAVDNPVNKSVRIKCIQQAIYYNGNGYDPKLIPMHKSVSSLQEYKKAINSPPPLQEMVYSLDEEEEEYEDEDEVQIVENPKPRKRKVEEPQVEWNGTAYMQSDLWRQIKRRLVKINNSMKSGDKEAILEGNLIEEQVSDYLKLMKRLYASGS